MYMRGVTAIEPEWLPKFAPTLCNLSEPLNEPPPRYSATITLFCKILLYKSDFYIYIYISFAYVSFQDTIMKLERSFAAYLAHSEELDGNCH
jgi:hypothetical protein